MRSVKKPVDVAYEYVRSGIMSKTMFPGNRVSEEDLTRAVGVSRTSVRSALAKLQNDGLVEVVPNKGAFISRPTRENIESVYYARLHLERASIELAAPRITEKAIARLEENLAQQRTLKQHFTILTYSHLNRAFHMEVAAASQNEYIYKYLNELLNKTQIFQLYFDLSVDNTGSLQTHGDVVEALKVHDAHAAIDAITRDNQLSVGDLSGLQF